MASGPVSAQSRRPTDDLNGDGKVTVAEYTEARSARAMARMDLDNDGKVTANERAALSRAGVDLGGVAGESASRAPFAGGSVGARATGGAGIGETTAADMKSSMGARAQALDANGDGVLSLEELRSGRGSQPLATR